MTGDLSPSDCAELQELWLGPNPNLGSLFADRQELREAWEQHRVEVMALFAKDGRRPMGWWEFEAPGLGLKYPDDEREQSYLFEQTGVLPEDERAELLSFWRNEFERAHSPSYDTKARRKHFRDVDIPARLIREWTAERRRRATALRKLARGNRAA
jgi:hypothetical protein